MGSLSLTIHFKVSKLMEISLATYVLKLALPIHFKIPKFMGIYHTTCGQPAPNKEVQSCP